MRQNQTVTMAVVAAETEGGAPSLAFDIKGAGVVVLNLANVSAANRQYAEIHGWKQRIVDAAALSRNTADGKSAAPEAKRDAIAKLVEHYMSGTDKWTMTAEGGSKGGLLFEALCEMYGHAKAPSEIREFLDALSDKEAAALREDDEVRPVIDRLKAARAAAIPEADRVKTKDLLGKIKAATPTEEPKAE